MNNKKYQKNWKMKENIIQLARKLFRTSVLGAILMFGLKTTVSTIISHEAEDKMPPKSTVIKTSVLVNRNHPENKLEDIECITSELWKVNNENEKLPVVWNNASCLVIRIINNNSKLMYMNSIWISVEQYEPIEQIDEKEKLTGLGDIGETINITAVLGTEEGMYPVQTGNQDIDVSYIKIAPDDMEIFILDIDFDKEGIYDISVQFKYGYGDKEYSIGVRPQC